MKCKYCALRVAECLTYFECTAYRDVSCRNVIYDGCFKNINEAINWAKDYADCRYLKIYQGCSRENLIYEQTCNEDK